MEIVIVAPGMAFGPKTLDHRSLGGSEQAGLLISKSLAKLNHHVTCFCDLPKQGMPDAVPSGALVDGVRWVDIRQYRDFIINSEVDLLVVQRDFRLLNMQHQAKKAVLWAHDLATHTWTTDGVSQLGTNWNEVWCVSEFHRQQFHKVTGYPLERIRATRNGILPVKTMDMGGRTKTLLYAARPERGLVHLIKPGGVMDQLKGKGYTLRVSMYENFPPQMKEFYEQMYRVCQERPDVEHMGCLTQAKLRQEMRNAFAYVYCTDFEETSCLIARECAEQRLPMVYSESGALPETVGSRAGVCVGPFEDSEAYFKKFAENVMYLEKGDVYSSFQKVMNERDDLYWDGVAREWTSSKWAKLKQKVSLFSRAWSLVEDSDVIPAIALLESARKLDWASERLYADLKMAYPFLSFGGEAPEITLKEHYDRYYKEIERPKTDVAVHDVRNQGRWKALHDSISALPAGSKILDYACGEGSQLICLAMEHPDKDFYGIDISEDEIECLVRNAKEQGLPVGESNIKGAWVGTCDKWPMELMMEPVKTASHEPLPLRPFDAAMMNEVLEHVHEPWDVATKVEQVVKPGGRIILTVPNGPWEMIGIRQSAESYPWRAHIWHLDKPALRKMFNKKSGNLMARIPNGVREDGRCLGNTIYSYTADHKPVSKLVPIKKAREHHSRETVGAALICMNDEDTILKLLNSIKDQIQVIQFAQGPSSDSTRDRVDAWLADHPWIYARWFDVPKVHPPGDDGKGFGFCDARNASVEGLPTSWTLWIDTDEYLSGDIRKYTRDHAFDAMALHQHHFTCDPRGAPTQIDRPARLYRNGKGFKCYGKVHEHFEISHNGGPGYCMLVGDVDIGHTGYVNESVRRRRFLRNFPLLEWDRKVDPDRKLGKFLWFRDIVHRMRYFQETNRGDLVGKMAQEAVEFYLEHRDDMDCFGQGTFQAYAYYGEALRILGRGLDFEVSVRMTDPDSGHARTMSYGGNTADADDLTAVLKKIVGPEIEKRNSRYWR
jgi:2-polyprenyl-3-methyl-5-hydroxy-6-metoxy-1,4-benzoquinol methylase